MSHRGVTILELMLAMLISSVILTGLGTIYVIGIKTWRQAESKLDLRRQGSMAIAEIKKWTQPADSVEIGSDYLRARLPETDSTAAVWHLFEARNHRLYRDDSVLTEVFDDLPGRRKTRVSDFKVDWNPWLKTVRVELQLTLDPLVGVARLPEIARFDSRIKVRNMSL